MKVFWTRTALHHLDSIFQYISQDSSQYALQTVDRLTRRSEQIGKFPHSGRKVPEIDAADIREVLEGPYRIIYRIQPDLIDVLAVIHSMRDLGRLELGDESS